LILQQRYNCFTFVPYLQDKDEGSLRFNFPAPI